MFSIFLASNKSISFRLACLQAELQAAQRLACEEEEEENLLATQLAVHNADIVRGVAG